MASHSIEVTEAEQPIQLLAYEFVPDKAGAGKYPRRRAVPARLPLPRGRRHAAGALRPARPSAVRPLWRQPGRAVGELPQPRQPRTALLPVKLTMTIKQRRRLPPCAGRRRRLGRSAGARSGRRAARRAQRASVARRRPLADYGVVVDTAHWTVDEAATAQPPRRDRERARLDERARRSSGTIPMPLRTRRRSSRMADHLSRRCRHRRHLHRHRAARLRRHHPHQEDLVQRRATTPRRSSRASREVFRETGLDRRRDRGDPPRHHRRLQRHPRAQGRAGRADHHQGLPRRAGDPHAAHAASSTTSTWTKPAPLVERYLRQVVDERIDHRGQIERALDPADAERAVDALLAEKVEAIAVCLLNSFANPAHEADAEGDHRAQGAAICRSSISFEVLPEIKEYERTSTTVINAYVMPIVATLPAGACARASTTPASRRACC